MTESNPNSQNQFNLEGAVVTVQLLTREIDEQKATRASLLALTLGRFDREETSGDALNDLALYCLATDRNLADTMDMGTLERLKACLAHIMSRLDACRGQAIVMLEMVRTEVAHRPGSRLTHDVTLSDTGRTFKVGILPLTGQLLSISPVRTEETGYLDIRACAPTPLSIDVRAIGVLSKSEIRDDACSPIELAFPANTVTQLWIGDDAVARLRQQTYVDVAKLSLAMGLARESLPPERELDVEELARTGPPAHQVE